MKTPVIIIIQGAPQVNTNNMGRKYQVNQEETDKYEYNHKDSGDGYRVDKKIKFKEKEEHRIDKKIKIKNLEFSEEVL